MAAEQLQIQVQANVQQAIAGLNSFNTQLDATAKASESLGATSLNILNNQLQRLQKIAANPNLSTEQYQRLATIINKTSKEADVLSKSIQVLNRSNGTLTGGANQANTAMINLGRTVSDAPFGFIGIANNIGPLVENFTQLRKESGSTGGALKQLGASLAGPGGLIVGIQLAVAAVQFAQLGLSRWTQKTRQAKEEQDEIAKSIAGQYTQVLLLKNAYQQDKSLEGRREILKQLNQVSNVYFGNLKAEETSIKQLQNAYDGYINNLLQSFAVKQLEADLEPLVKQLAVAQSIVRKLEPDLEKLGLIKSTVGLTGQALADAIKFNNELQNGFKNLSDQQRKALAPSGVFKYNEALNESNKLWNQINETIQNQSVLFSKSNTQAKGSGKTQQTLQEKINELLSDYRNTLQSISYEEQIRSIDQSNQKLETNLDFLKRAADLVGFTGQAYKIIAKDTEAFIQAASNQKIVDVIKAYQTAISELDIKQAVTGQDQLNARINSATDALIKLKTLGVQETNEEFIKLQNTLNGLQAEVGLREIRKRTEEIKRIWANFQLQSDKLNFNKTRNSLDLLKAKIDNVSNTIIELKAKGLTEKDLGLQFLGAQLDQLNKQYEKLQEQKKIYTEITSILTNELGRSVDNIFDSFVKGEDVFDSLRNSLANFIIDIGKATAKTLILRSVTNAIAPGSGGLLGGGVGGGGLLTVRGDYLRNSIFG